MRNGEWLTTLLPWKLFFRWCHFDFGFRCWLTRWFFWISFVKTIRIVLKSYVCFEWITYIFWKCIFIQYKYQKVPISVSRAVNLEIFVFNFIAIEVSLVIYFVVLKEFAMILIFEKVEHIFFFVNSSLNFKT